MRSVTERIVSFLLAAAAAAFVVGCGMGNPAAEARRVRDRIAAENVDHLRFDLEIARGAKDPARRRQVIDAISNETFAVASDALDVVASDPPPEARDALRRVFDNKTGVLKLRAAIALGRLGDEDAIGYLDRQMSDPAQTLVPEAIQVLASRGGEAKVGPIVATRADSDTLAIREEAYAALAAIREPWATDRLLSGLEREHGEERRSAIEALGRTGDPRAAAAIERFVNTKGLVFASIRALGASGNPEAREAVRTMLTNDEPTVRVYAASALWRLGAGDEAEPVLVELASSDDAAVRAVVAEELAPVADEAARAVLAGLAKDPERTVRLAAVRSLAEAPRAAEQASLLEAASDADYQIQTVALTALAKIGDREALSVVRPLLASDNPYVALAAAHATVEIVARTAA